MAEGQGFEGDRYVYYRDLPLGMVQQHLTEITESFHTLKERYNGPISRFRKTLRKGDQEVLGSFVGELLPMSMSQAVQEEATGYQGDSPDGLTLYRAAGLTSDIMLFTARFEDTGVTVYRGVTPFE